MLDVLSTADPWPIMGNDAVVGSATQQASLDTIETLLDTSIVSSLQYSYHEEIEIEY